MLCPLPLKKPCVVCFQHLIVKAIDIGRQLIPQPLIA
jgi:hypothetical protein